MSVQYGTEAGRPRYRCTLPGYTSVPSMAVPVYSRCSALQPAKEPSRHGRAPGCMPGLAYGSSVL